MAAPPLVPDVPTITRPSLRMLADRPLGADEDDRLGYRAYADALAELIDNPETDTPLTIAISAPWGAGKTSLAKLVEHRLIQWPTLRGERPHVVCWFNAWTHDDAPHLGAAFAADVAKSASRFRPLWWRLASPLPSAMLNAQERWRRRALFALVALGVASVLAAWIPGIRDLFAAKDELVPKIDHAFGARLGSLVFVLVAVYALWSRLFAFGRAAASFVDDPRSEAARGSMHEVSGQLGSLVRQATRGRRELRLFGRVLRTARSGRRRLVIFVDDLERCRPPRAVEVCEVATQLLGHPDVVTVLVADMGVIATSADIKYAELERRRADDPDARVDYGRFYLQKMVQIQFDLPAAPLDSMRQMLANEPKGPEVKLRRAAAPASGAPATADAERASPWSREATKIAAAAIGAVAAVAGTLLAIWPTARPSGSASTSSISDLPAVATAAAVAVSVLYTAGRSIRSYFVRQTRERIDDEIKEKAGSVAASPDRLAAEVMQSDAVKGKHETLVRQRVQRFLTDESVLRREAESEILKFLPPLPRSAKRMLNHLRVLLTIAVGRDMFGGRPALTPSHLGKWVVLNERWPELVRELSVDPGKLRGLERLTSISGLARSLKASGLDGLASGDLLRFLQVPPRLASVVERLVYLGPSAGPGP